jgi:hypothetical protein
MQRKSLIFLSEKSKTPSNTILFKRTQTKHYSYL